MMRITARRRTCFYSAASVLALASPAAAQNADASAASPSAADPAPTRMASEIGDIVVTAQKRAENVQNVPISVAAFGAATLEQSHITAVVDLPKLTPNFNVSRGQQVASIGLRIRGVGAAGSTATEPSVATFVDGVYVPRPGALFASFLDIQGVEVLRGPQGTLFGRNASVGAVSLRTGTPGDRFAADLKAEAGTGDRYRLEGAVDIPVAGDVSLRVAGIAGWFNGYWHNDQTGKSFGGQDNQAVRATLKVKPWSNVTWLVRGEYTHIRGDGFPMEDLLPETVPAAKRAVLQQRLGGVLPDFNPYNKSTNEYIDSRLRDRQWAVSSDLTIDTAGDFALRLVDSYRDWHNRQRDADVTFMPIPILARDGEFSSGSQSHELQIISPKDKLLGGKLDFVAGLYYFRERFAIGEQLSLFDNLCNLVGPLRATCLAGPLARATDLQFRQTVNSYAAYGQATYRILPSLELTLGGRYTKDDKDGTFVQVARNPVAARIIRAPENDVLKTDGGKFTYRINLSWHPAERVMLFANYSTGYKSGGFNSGGGNIVLGQSRVFRPENVKDYEAGIKSTFLDRAVQLNATLFRTDINGFQDRAVNGTSFIVRNAGNLRQQGVEFDSILALVKGFRLNGSVAYLDSEFTSYAGAPNLPGLPGSQNLTGKRATFSPRWSGAVGAQYDGTLSRLSWSLRSDLSFNSKQNIGQVTDNNPQEVEPGHALLGARLTLYGPDRLWSVAIFGDNLTDKRYCTQRQYQTIDTAFGLQNAGSTATRCFLGDPRTIGVAVTKHL